MFCHIGIIPQHASCIQERRSGPGGGSPDRLPSDWRSRRRWNWMYHHPIIPWIHGWISSSPASLCRSWPGPGIELDWIMQYPAYNCLLFDLICVGRFCWFVYGPTDRSVHFNTLITERKKESKQESRWYLYIYIKSVQPPNFRPSHRSLLPAQ